MGALSNVKRGIEKRPIRCLVFGEEGVGKTTFTTTAPNTLIVDLEDGAHQLDCSRVYPKNLKELKELIKELEEVEHEYQTLAIDSVDILEQLADDEVCKEEGVEAVASIAYGKGTALSREKVYSILVSLNRLLKSKKMNIILVAHSEIRLKKDPTGIDHEFVDVRAGKKVVGLLKEQVDIVGYLAIKTVYTTDSTTKAVKADSTGVRVLSVAPCRGASAKNRYGITEPLEATWGAVMQAVKEASVDTVGELEKEIRKLLEGLPEETKADIESKVEPLFGKGDTKKLMAAVNRLKRLQN